MQISKTIRDNVAMIMMMNAVVLTVPAIANATAEEYHPINFTQPIKLERGVISPIAGQHATYLNDEETCRIMKEMNGWSDCANIDRLVIGLGQDIDSVAFTKPVSDGYVKLDDFFASGTDEGINAIVDELKEDAKEQSKQLGYPVEVLGWRLKPTADKQKGLIYYALDVSWNHKQLTNIKVMLLDRQGYVAETVVPITTNLDAAGIKKVVDQAVSIYKPNQTTEYASYTPGDKVAAYGGMGVLATVLGVKYGKAATVGMGILLAAFLKKGALLLALPFIFVGRLFRRIFPKKDQK
jgi:uncharacterized membrane-anchored protein